MHDIFEGLNSVFAGVAVILSIYTIIYAKKNDHKAETNKRLDDMDGRINENSDLIANNNVMLTNHQSEIEHISDRLERVEVLHKPDIQRIETSINKVQDDMQSIKETVGKLDGQVSMLVQFIYKQNPTMM